MTVLDMRRYVGAAVSRLRGIEAELHNLSAAVRHQSAAIVDFGVELRARMDELHGHLAETDERVRTVIAAQWDQQAMARRIAALEDRLVQQSSDHRERSEQDGPA